MARHRRSSINSTQRSGHGGLIVGFVILVLLVAIAYVMFGGEDGGVPPTNGPPSRDILSRAIEATSSVTSQRFNIVGSITMSSRNNRIPLFITGEGEVDINQKKMRVKVNIDLPLSPLAPETEEQTIETYVVGNVLYAYDGEVWRKTTSSQDLWEKRQVPQNLINFLTGTTSKLLGIEVINGKETYKIAIMPTVRELFEKLQDLQPAGINLPTLTDNNIREIEQAVKNLDLFMWIDKSTYLPAKVEMNLLFEFAEGIQKLNVEIQMEMSTEYNVAVSIDLPPGAQTAVESGVIGF